jgi:hypothetical protein
MALGTPVHLVTNANQGNDANSYATAAATQASFIVNDLIVAFVGAEQTTVDPTTPTMTTNNGGPTMTRLASADNNWGGAGATRRVQWTFLGKITAAPSGNVTFTADFGGVTQIGCEIKVTRIPGAHTGPGATSAVGTPAIGSGTGDLASLATMGAAVASTSRALAMVHTNLNAVDIVPEAGGNWTQLNDNGHGTPSISFMSMYTASSFDTTATATWTPTATWGTTAIEIIEAAYTGTATFAGAAAATAATGAVTFTGTAAFAGAAAATAASGTVSAAGATGTATFDAAAAATAAAGTETITGTATFVGAAADFAGTSSQTIAGAATFAGAAASFDAAGAQAITGAATFAAAAATFDAVGAFTDNAIEGTAAFDAAAAEMAATGAITTPNEGAAQVHGWSIWTPPGPIVLEGTCVITIIAYGTHGITDLRKREEDELLTLGLLS